MPNNIAVSVTADVADLTAKRAILSAELKAATKDLTDLAKVAAAGGGTKELSAEMLAAADSVSKLQHQIANTDTQLKTYKSHAEETSGSLKELAEGMKAFFAAEIIQKASEAFEGFQRGVEGSVESLSELSKTAGVLGVSASFLQQFNFAARQSDVDVGSADKALQALNESLGAVQANLPRAKQAAETFKALGFTPDQLRQFHDAGDLFPVLADRISKVGNAAEEAAIARKLGISDLIPMLNQGAAGFNSLAQKANDLGVVMDQSTIEKAEEAKKKLTEVNDVVQSKLNVQFVQFADTLIFVKEKFGEAELAGLHFLAQLTNTESVTQKLKDLQVSLGGLNTQVKLQGGRIDPAQVGIYRQITASLIADTAELRTQQGVNRELTQSAQQRAAATALLPDKEKKAAKGPDAVSEWAEQLHAQEVASNEFFQDQTAQELAFWQSKLGLTTQGSKDWLAVQSKIYDASKALAHQNYDEQLAALNDQLEADRDNWSKEQADWNDKLAFIRGKNGEKSTEYENAYREFEAAEREHTQRMAEIAKQGAQARVDQLKADLAAERSIREADARTTEQLLNEQAKYEPLGEIRAAQQIAALHRQTTEQEIADAQAVHAAQMVVLNQEVAAELAANKQNSTQYNAAAIAKEKADQEWARQKRALLDQAANQEIADQLKVQQAWHSTIDPMVASVGQNMKGLIEGTETWGQALRNVGESIASVVEQALERMVENWIVGMLTGHATQKATAASQVSYYAGIAGAAGVASMAAAPWPIDMTAPGFGAAMQGAALGLGAIASFDVGTNYVPNDMVAKIHEGERIVPRADNRAMMDAIAAGGAGAGAGGPSLIFGDTHIHTSSTAPDIRAALRQHRDDLMDVVNSAYRANYRHNLSSPFRD